MSVPQASQPIQIRPIINYPREAQVGQTYLMSIDVQLASPDAVWPYPDEEYPITFILNTQPYFRYESLNGEREPGIVLHRFGGTYGPAQYLLTASEQEVERGHISITFLNGWDVPMTYLELECVVKAEVATNKEQKITVLSKEKVLVVPQNPSDNQEEKSSSEELQSSYQAAHSSQEVDEETYGSQETDEERTRRFELIKGQLKQTGWAIYHFDDEELIHYFADRNRGEGIAVASHPNLPDGYMLFIARQLVGIIKTRPIGAPLTSIEAKETLIATMESLLSISIIRTGYPTLPFFYGITDGEMFFTNYLEPESQSRRVFTFHRPETLAKWLEQAPPNIPASQNNLFRSRLKRMPTLQRKGLREHQFETISNLESSLALNKRHSLIQMETGTGVTFTALNIIHRLLKYGRAKRVLYALDTPIAKDYVTDILQVFVPSEGDARLIDLYDIDDLSGNMPDPGASICIATLDYLYSIFQAYPSESFFPSPVTYPVASENGKIGYNQALPIEYFDVIVMANCDSYLYRQWQPLLGYFDAFIVGMTEEADEQLVSLFANNLVYQQEPDLPHALILTSQPEEYRAARAQMGNIEQTTHLDTVYEQSVFASEHGEWRVGLAQIYGVPARAAIEAGRVISNFNPRVVLLVGTAVGVKGMVPGDVVFATQVFSYDPNQEQPFILRTEMSEFSEALEQRARLEAHRSGWLQRISPHDSSSEVPEATPRVFIGPIMDGSTIPEYSTFFSLTHTLEILRRDILAADMGVETFLQALELNPGVQFAIIRGIEGLIGEDRQPRSFLAAHHAAAFAFELLAKLGVDGAAKLDAELSASSAMAETDATGNFEIFYAYAHEDRALVRQLQKHLTVLTRQDDNITEWDESKIMPDQNWRDEIKRHLDTARVILVCISPDFLASERFSSLSWEYVLKRYEAGEAVIIPILLRPADWRDSPFYRFQALPRNGRAVSSHASEDQALAKVAQEIIKVVEKMRASSA